MVIPAACYAAHTPAVTTLEVEFLKHCLSLCLGQVRHVYAWKNGVERLLWGEFQMPPHREVDQEERDPQNDARTKEQGNRCFSV
jgi:hypothetical protein